MNKTDIVLYIDGLIKEDIKVPYYKAKRLLDIHNIDIKNIKFVSGESLLLKSITKNQDASVNVEISEKSWVKYLPEIYSQDKILVEFLYGFQLLLLKQKDIVDNSERLITPEISSQLDWLASWFGISFNELVRDDSKRIFIYRILSLYSIRGTKKYLIEIVKIIMDIEITIKERYIPQTVIQNEYDIIHEFDIKKSFTVVIEKQLSQDKELEKRKLNMLKKLVLKEKPAFTICFFEYKYLEEEIYLGDVITKNSNTQDDEYEYDNDIIDFSEEDKRDIEPDKQVKIEINNQSDDYDYDY